MPAAAIIPAAIGAGSSLFSGILGAGAAKGAANTQAQAAQQAMQQWQNLIAQYNPQIGTTAATGASNVANQAAWGGANLMDTAGRAAQDITGAGQTAAGMLNPYIQAGGGAAKTLADLMAPGGDLSRQFTANDMQTMDPGYQFRIDQANRIAQQSAAAKGGALGGGALQQLTNVSQNVASSEMQNAFNRFQQQQQQRYQQLYGVAGLGAGAAGTAGNALLNAATTAGGLTTGAAQTAGGWNLGAGEFGANLQSQAAQQMEQNAAQGQTSISDLMTGGAAARAAGQVGAANAYGGMFGGLANAAGQVGQYYNQQNLLNRFFPQGGGGFTPYSQGNAFNLPGGYTGTANMPTYGSWPFGGYQIPQTTMDMFGNAAAPTGWPFPISAPAP